MSHREKSLTPWIKNNPGARPAKYADFTVEQINAEAQRPDISDEDKHAICLIRTGHPCTPLPPKMYDDAVRQGCDMANFVKNKPMPTDPGGRNLHGVYAMEHKMPTSEQMRAEMQRKIDAGEPLGTWHVPDKMVAVVANGSVTGYSKHGPSDKPRWMDCPGALNGAMPKPAMCECGDASHRCRWPACGTMGRNR